MTIVARHQDDARRLHSAHSGEAGEGATLWGAMVSLGGWGQQERVRVSHSTSPITFAGRPRGVARMGPKLTRWGGGFTDAVRGLLS